MKSTVHIYIKKGNRGYDFYKGYKYDTIDGKKQVVENTFVVTETTLYGLCTIDEKFYDFDTAEDGDEFFKNLLDEGYKICSKSEYYALKPWD